MFQFKERKKKKLHSLNNKRTEIDRNNSSTHNIAILFEKTTVFVVNPFSQ